MWSSIMDPNVNPLSNITNLKVRHMVMQILAFMWSGVFSLYIVDSIFVFGITSIAVSYTHLTLPTIYSV